MALFTDIAQSLLDALSATDDLEVAKHLVAVADAQFADAVTVAQVKPAAQAVLDAAQDEADAALEKLAQAQEAAVAVGVEVPAEKRVSRAEVAE